MIASSQRDASSPSDFASGQLVPRRSFRPLCLRELSGKLVPVLVPFVGLHIGVVFAVVLRFELVPSLRPWLISA